MYMKTYRMLVRSDESEALELFAEMASDLRAAEYARQRIAADPRILEIEIWSGDARLCRMQGRRAEPAAASPVQFGVVAEDALFVEGNAARRG